jgi:hypothetical protein
MTFVSLTGTVSRTTAGGAFNRIAMTVASTRGIVRRRILLNMDFACEKIRDFEDFIKVTHLN